MKSKSKNQIPKKKSEFRYHKVQVIGKKGEEIYIRHPSYVFLEKGNIFIYVTITHSGNIKNVVTIKLRKNPNPHDNRESFRVAEVNYDTKDTFGKRQKGWQMDPEDDQDIREEYKKKMILSIGISSDL